MIEDTAFAYEELGRAIFSSHPAHIAVLNTRGDIVAVNAAWTRFAQENSGDFTIVGVGVNYFEICGRATGQMSVEAQEALDGIRAVLDRRLANFQIEYPCHSPTQNRWFLMSVAPLSDAEGGAIVSHLEITARKQTDHALRQSEAGLRQLADAMPQIVWTTDAEGNVEYFNNRWTEYTGRAVEQSLGSNWKAVVHPDDLENAVRLWRHAVDTGEAFQNEHRFRRADGEYRWQLARGVAMREGGRVVRWFGTCTDIDDHKRTEEILKTSRDALEAANKAKDRFLSVLSHELRTPLMPVLMTVQSLQDEPGLSRSAIDGLEVIRRNVELEARLIDDLLDLTRISKGRLQLNIDVIDLHAVIRNAMDICAMDIVAKKLTTTLDLAAQRHVVRGDPARLQQVMWNLIKNAIKFTNEGGYVTVHTFDDANGLLKVQVIDNGIGIQSDALSRIFDAFEQGDRSIAREFGGLGLGLAISKSLVEMHDGQLAAFSSGPGRGATFTLELRPILSDAPASAGEDAPPQSPETKRDIRILLVDDHHDTNRAMARLLQCMGYEVQTADSVSSALEAARQTAFDLLVSDIGLPDGSGLELMRKLLENSPIKGIALSGFGMEEDVKKSKEAGFYEHLTKPINLKRLETAIRDLTGSDTSETVESER